jgi:hypothetical protein
MLVFLAALSSFAMYNFARRTVKIGYFFSIVAGLIYVLSPIFFTRAVAGHLYYLVSYSISPLLFLLFVKALEERRNWLPCVIVAGLLFGLVGVQIQFFVMVFIILLMLVIVN